MPASASNRELLNFHQRPSQNTILEIIVLKEQVFQTLPQIAGFSWTRLRIHGDSLSGINECYTQNDLSANWPTGCRSRVCEPSRLSVAHSAVPYSSGSQQLGSCKNKTKPGPWNPPSREFDFIDLRWGPGSKIFKSFLAESDMQKILISKPLFIKFLRLVWGSWLLWALEVKY